MKLKILLAGSVLFLFVKLSFAQNMGQSATQYKGNIYHMGGNVGIGTSIPSFKLEVKASANNSATIVSRNATGGIATFMHVNSDGSGNFYARGSDNSTNNTVSINGGGNSYLKGGNVGIGTTSPVSKLDVKGGVNISSFNSIASFNGFHNTLQLTDAGSAAILYNSGQSTELMFGFHSN